MSTPAEQKGSKAVWIFLWILITLLTLPASFIAFLVASDTCDPQAEMQILCTPADQAHHAAVTGVVLILVWIAVSVALLIGAASRESH
jgi:flagellar basal body-associated protein FliL